MVSQNVGKRFAPPAYSSTSTQDAYAYAPSRHYEQSRRRGGKGKIVLFAVLGVVLALVVLVGVYAAMMIPSVKSVKATAEGIVLCLWCRRHECARARRRRHDGH